MNSTSVTCTLGPSLALTKYWGKKGKAHIPATTSIAVSLNALQTSVTVINTTDADLVAINGNQLDSKKVKEYYCSFLDFLRCYFRTSDYFDIQISNNFPIAAGLASSSSIFASLTYSIASLYGCHSLPRISSLARIGSTSAARALFGGFVIFPRGAKRAHMIYPPEYWHNLRVIVVITDHKPKHISTRSAMKLAQHNLSAYRGWLISSRKIVTMALQAIKKRDIQQLGDAMRASYLGMHATMLSAYPPIFFWNYKSVFLIQLCEKLRLKGIEAWETMDAGPQVKILTLASQVSRIVQEIESELPDTECIATELGCVPQLQRLTPER